MPKVRNSYSVKRKISISIRYWNGFHSLLRPWFSDSPSKKLRTSWKWQFRSPFCPCRTRRPSSKYFAAHLFHRLKRFIKSFFKTKERESDREMKWKWSKFLVCRLMHGWRILIPEPVLSSDLSVWIHLTMFTVFIDFLIFRFSVLF